MLPGSFFVVETMGFELPKEKTNPHIMLKIGAFRLWDKKILYWSAHFFY